MGIAELGDPTKVLMKRPDVVSQSLIVPSTDAENREFPETKIDTTDAECPLYVLR